MRHVDLELYRWKYHNDLYIHSVARWRPDAYPIMNWVSYWKEYGAFVSVLPRQSGKSDMLIKIYQELKRKEATDSVLLVCGHKQAIPRFIKDGISRKEIYYPPGAQSLGRGFCKTAYRWTHLLIDEFDVIDRKNHLIHILDCPWKSVTMVSSLR